MQHTAYNASDIEEFLKVDDAQEHDESKIMKKLLSVQNKISIFVAIEPDDLKAIIYDLKFIKYSRKDILIKEGDVSKNIFFILSGDCQVFVKNHKVGELTKGQSLGETAAIFNTPRNATVACSSENATILSFSIDHDNMQFCGAALAQMYKNLAFEINSKLEDMNKTLSK